MKLSTKGRYGLRAMIDLALNCSDGAVSISSIAERQNLSDSYLEQLMAKLKKAGLVSSLRGASGGYTLAREPQTISVGDILRALEGDLIPVDCAALYGGECDESDCCVTKYVWQRLNDSLNDTMNAIKLSDLMDESKKTTNCGL